MTHTTHTVLHVSFLSMCVILFFCVRTPKERIIVLGTGWGAASFLKSIDCNKYDVTVISPRNYFVFTPMLAGASVGTVEFRSITEPVREVRLF